MSESTLYLGGVPTKPDVDKLREKFGVPKEGQVVEFSEIEETIGVHRRSPRFNTVVQSWRKALDREHNVVFGPERGVGLVCLPPDDRIELAVHKRKVGVRMIGRAGRFASFTDKARLTPENKRAADHMERSVAAIKLALATSAKRIELPDPEKKG